MSLCGQIRQQRRRRFVDGCYDRVEVGLWCSAQMRVGSWICRRRFKCWTQGCYCRQRWPALDLEDGVEVGFVDGTEDGVVD